MLCTYIPPVEFSLDKNQKHFPNKTPKTWENANKTKSSHHDDQERGQHIMEPSYKPLQISLKACDGYSVCFEL